MQQIKAYRIKDVTRLHDGPILKSLVAGSVVFSFPFFDNGRATAVSDELDTLCAAVCEIPNDEKANFYVIPFEDLTPVIHHEMVGQLAKHPFEIGSFLYNTPDATNLVHMGIGIADEYFEYRLAKTSENMLEELGDLLFYTEGLLLSVDIPRATILATPVATCPIDEILRLTFETIKRRAFYEKDLAAASLARAYQGLIGFIEAEAIASGFPGGLEDVRQANINKLGVRYRDFCYSNAAAIARADKQGTDEEECPICHEVGPEHNSRCPNGKA